jgi:HlyD family secretion protein
MKTKPIWFWVIIVVLGLSAIGGIAWYALRGTTKAVGPATALVTRRDLAATVTATGTIRAVVGAEVKVGSRIPGRVQMLAVQVGDRVTAGQVIARLEQDDLRAAVDRATADVAAAEAKAAQVRADLQVMRASADLTIAQASSRLSQARTRLQLLLQGARPEEIAQAEAALRQAEANYALAAANADRDQALYDQGFVARLQLDAARRDAGVASEQVRAAREQLALVRNRYRPEDIKIGQDEVQQAETELALAQANARQVAAKEHELQAAQANVRAARATVNIAQANLGYATIAAPLSGIVASVSTQQGETVISGSAAGEAPTFVTIIDLDRLEVHAFVDETDIGKVRVGQEAVFTVDSFPDRQFTGKVTAIYPKALIQLNVVTYDVVIAIDNRDGLLRPDMTASVIITVAKREAVLAVPTQAVRREEGQRVAYVVEGAQLVRRPIKVGWKDKTYTEVLGGLREGDRVVVGDVGTAKAPATSTLPPGAK